MLAASISEYAEENRLDGGGLSEEGPDILWTMEDGRLYANAEHIAKVTEETVNSYGCVDHAHVFGRAAVDFTSSGVKLTDLGASGS